MEHHHLTTTATEATVLTREMLERALEAIKTEAQRPHTCVIHPRGGFCFECGQYWRRELDGTYHPVTG